MFNGVHRFFDNAAISFNRFQLAMTRSFRYNRSILLILPPVLVTADYETSVSLAIRGGVDLSADGTTISSFTFRSALKI